MYDGKLLCMNLKYNFYSCNAKISVIVKIYNFLNSAVCLLYSLNVVIRIALF